MLIQAPPAPVTPPGTSIAATRSILRSPIPTRSIANPFAWSTTYTDLLSGDHCWKPKPDSCLFTNSDHLFVCWSNKTSLDMVCASRATMNRPSGEIRGEVKPSDPGMVETRPVRRSTEEIRVWGENTNPPKIRVLPSGDQVGSHSSSWLSETTSGLPPSGETT